MKAIPISDLLNLTTDQMRKMDHLMIEDYPISLLEILECTGRSKPSPKVQVFR